MSDRIMKNFPIEYEGNVYWRSRSVAVVGFVYGYDFNNGWCVLANKRGPGCPDEIGKWCCPCGYLDFNEDGRHAVSREIFEETGVKINPEDFREMGINFETDRDQNVSIRYSVISKITDTNSNNSEEKEVDDIKWIPIKKVNEYDWAFNHGHRLVEIAKQLYLS